MHATRRLGSVRASLDAPFTRLPGRAASVGRARDFPRMVRAPFMDDRVRRSARGMRNASVGSFEEDPMTHAISGFELLGEDHASHLRTSLRKLLELVPFGFGYRGADVPVSLAGEIRTAGALADILALLAQSGRAGTLIVEDAEGARALSVARGELVRASSTVPAERIGALVHRAIPITRDELDEASVLAAIDGRRLGEVLVSDGRIDAKRLDALLARQAEAIFHAALAVSEGAFCFVEEDIDAAARADDERPSLIGLLMEGARRADELGAAASGCRK
jgi:hypothetical protein